MNERKRIKRGLMALLLALGLLLAATLPASMDAAEQTAAPCWQCGYMIYVTE
jgi:hypothetical protein